ncbi:hypothetical protein OSB04_011521 [Centaurea solstitialis]|uniref:Integrase catalytic domain-containing protein n=1 Tax=Centaurea solstitialis TaxID=347529 RepID=A0AA38WDR8_9ASTR|nr:hypothetical protein OSB04_011521 [Centaurea solstitialis]
MAAVVVGVGVVVWFGDGGGGCGDGGGVVVVDGGGCGGVVADEVLENGVVREGCRRRRESPEKGVAGKGSRRKSYLIHISINRFSRLSVPQSFQPSQPNCHISCHISFSSTSFNPLQPSTLYNPYPNPPNLSYKTHTTHTHNTQGVVKPLQPPARQPAHDVPCLLSPPGWGTKPAAQPVLPCFVLEFVVVSSRQTPIPKAKFCLRTLHWCRPQLAFEDTTNRQQQKNINYYVRIIDYIYNFYLWESLDAKYKIEVACSKRFAVGNFLNFRIIDSKPVVKQVEELQVLVHELEFNIEKLPPSWKPFKLYLKHLTEEITFEQLLLKIRVEEDNGQNEKVDTFEPHANMVEGSSSKTKFQKFEGKGLHPRSISIPKKDLVLSNVVHVPSLTKNLIYSPVLSKKGFKLVFESDKVVITKGGVYVGKGYLHGGLLKLSVVNNDVAANVNNNKADSSSASFVYMVDVTSQNFEYLNLLEISSQDHHLHCSGKKITILSYYRAIALQVYEHNLLGHVNFRSIQRMIKLDMIPKCSIDKMTKCGKQNTLTIHISRLKKSNEILGLIHTDLCDFKATPTQGGKNYYISFIDDCNKYCSFFIGILPAWYSVSSKFVINFRDEVEEGCKFVDNMSTLVQIQLGPTILTRVRKVGWHSSKRERSPDQATSGTTLPLDLYFVRPWPLLQLISFMMKPLSAFKNYKTEVENKLDKKIKILRSDRGGEYKSHDFAEFCATHGIIHQTTAPYTPQQNGVTRRKNRTLKNMMNSMLITAGALYHLWGEACLTANMILNRIPHKKSDKSPYELWKGRLPSYKRLKVWGCLAKVQVPLPKRTKLGPKTVDVYILVLLTIVLLIDF